MQIIFIVFIAAYFVLAIIKKPNDKKGDDNFILASRKATLFPLVATLVTSQYGWISGVFETYFIYGPKAWFILSLPYLIINFIWIKLVSYLRNTASPILDTPALLAKHYGEKTGAITAVFYVWLLIPFMYVHMGAQLLEQYLQMPWAFAIILFLLLSSLAYFKGGFINILHQDKILFGCIYISLCMLFFSLISKPEIIQNHKNIVSIGIDQGLNWVLLSLIVFIDPAVHQRIWAAKSTNVIKSSFRWALFFWIIFDILIIGLVWQLNTKFSADLKLFSSIFALLNDWQGLILAILAFSVIISTANTYFFTASSFFNQYFMPKKWKIKYSFLSGLIIIVIVFIILYFGFQDKSVLSILFQFYPIAISALLLPVLTAILPVKKLSPSFLRIQLFSSAIICLLCQLDCIKITIFADAQALLFGLSASAIVQLLYYYVKSKKKR